MRQFKTPEERLATLKARLGVAKAPAGLKGRPLSGSPNKQIFTGIMLHSAARKAAGKELSDFESRFLKPLISQVGEEEVCEYGRIYTQSKRQEIPASTKRFPASISRMDENTPYTIADLINNVMEAAPEIAASPNHRIIDLSQVKDGIVYGAKNGITIIDAPKTDGSRARLAGPTREEADLRFELEMTRIRCNEDSDEPWDDEPYFGYSIGTDLKVERGGKTAVVQDMRTGSTASVDQPIFEGRVLHYLSGHIEAWEDDSDPIMEAFIDMLKDIATICSLTSDIVGLIPAAEEGEIFLAVIEQTAELIAFLLDQFSSADDFIDKKEFGITREALLEMVKNGTELQLDLSGAHQDPPAPDQGSYSVWIKACKPPGQILEGKLQQLTQDGSTWKESHELEWFSHHGAALIEFQGKVFSYWPRLSDHSLSVAVFDGNRWGEELNDPTYKPYSRPGVAVHGGKVWMVYRTYDDRIYLCSSSDGYSFSGGFYLEGNTFDAIALVSDGQNLHAFRRGQDGKAPILAASSPTGSTWSWWKVWRSEDSVSGPAACIWDGKICHAYVSALNDCPLVVEIRSKPTDDPQVTWFGGGLTSAKLCGIASSQGKLIVVWRDNSEKWEDLVISTWSGSSNDWSHNRPARNVPDRQPCLVNPNIASLGDKLHVLYPASVPEWIPGQ